MPPSGLSNYTQLISTLLITLARSLGGANIAEALVSKGLATVLRHKQDDDDRAPNYDDLLAAESKFVSCFTTSCDVNVVCSAIKSQSGVHAKKEGTPIRVNEISSKDQASRYLGAFKVCSSQARARHRFNRV